MTLHRRWTTTAVATTLLIVVAAIAFAIWRSTTRQELLTKLYVAAGQDNDVKLFGRLAAVPRASSERRVRGEDDRHRQRVRLEVLAAAVLQRIGDAKTPSDWHDSGVAHLLLDDPPDAVAALTSAVEQKDAPAASWSDLAAALIERGRHDNDPEHFAKALGAADRALRVDASLAAAFFNRASSSQCSRSGCVRTIS
jgi:hypothetical protein